MMVNFSNFLKISLLLFALVSCNNSTSDLNDDFDNIPDRIWIGKNYWAVPMEDWQVKNQRLEADGKRPEQRVNILTHLLTGEGKASISIDAGLIKKGEADGTAGMWIGMQDFTDNSIKSLCYFGRGINVGVHTEGYAFIDTARIQLSEKFDYASFKMIVRINSDSISSQLQFIVTDGTHSCEMAKEYQHDIKGMIALLNNNFYIDKFPGGPSFWFDNLKMSGTMVHHQSENSFGPILWSMYTMSRGKMKMTAQMPPMSASEDQTLELQLKKNNQWETIAEEKIQEDARIAVFSIDNWDDTQSHDYRLVYTEQYNDGAHNDFYYEGCIQRDPVDKPLTVGGLTCQEHQGYPYRPLVENLTKSNPDLLYFSGDQIYEYNGGYPIIRFPADRAILNYLGKWYMFGWAFGDVMRNRPTICIPDDHEVYQGNLWGKGGKNVSIEEWEKNADCTSGFVEPAEMVTVVMKTNCAHLPDPYDTKPMDQNIPVYYTDLIYGRISFAIVGDRIFKSGPEEVSWWEGRKDHIKTKIPNMSMLEKEGLEFLGERQLNFLEKWASDWKGADMKVLLSQTIFANAATHHGDNKRFLFGDMDSGGWPKEGRDNAVKTIRKAFAFHICGDQHLPSLIQYGVEKQRNAGWVFCTPAISVGYQRRFLPDMLGWSVNNRPEHNLPNTGEYQDGFGNYFFVQAVGIYEDIAFDKNRYIQAQKRTSGYGMITFNQIERTIKCEAIKFLTNVSDSNADRFYPGWPKTISQFDNYSNAPYRLSEIEISGINNPVMMVFEEASNELVFAVRIKGNSFIPKVYKQGKYKIKIGNPETDKWIEKIVSTPFTEDKLLIEFKK